MEIEFFNKYIDPTGKNVLTPDALTEYLGNPTATVTVPDFCPGETFEIPIAIAGRLLTYARIIHGGLPRYYFVSAADPADLDKLIMNLRFSMDFAHTLQIGNLQRTFAGMSVITRTTLSGFRQYAYEEERSYFSSVSSIGNSGSHTGLMVVAIFATKKTSTIFTPSEYSYVGLASDATVTTLNGALQMVRDLAGATTYTVPASTAASGVPAGPGDCSPVAFYVLPRWYGALFTVQNSTEYDINIGDTEHIKMWRPYVAASNTRTGTVNMNNSVYTYEIGNGSNRVIMRSPSGTIRYGVNFVLCGYPGEFSLTADIEGTRIDLTESCAIPFVVANENEIGVQVNKRNLALLGAGVTMASGAATQNGALVYGGAMSAVSSIADINSTSFPSIVGSGNLYRDSILPDGTVDPLALYQYVLSYNVNWRNKKMGPLCMGKFSEFPADAENLPSFYVEGDIYPRPLNYFDGLYIDRLRQFFVDGVRIFTTAEYDIT